MVKLAELTPQPPMSSQTQDKHSTSPDTGNNLSDVAASGVPLRGIVGSLDRPASPENAGVWVQAHE